ncbi:MAG: glycosyltransferase [Firmicutes bacterium HGW-Firmicutes-14]|jgi:glycosyltransferase involved in cell wall biosynthesis|nr:MAG: glycosyltransferase [Firmicutes bacterium HGW-Firmicutes-14]
MINDLCVAIPIIGSKFWLGGVSYIELLIKAINSLPRVERPQLYMVVSDRTLEFYDLHSHFVHLYDGIFYVGDDISAAKQKVNGQPLIQFSSYDELYQHIDFCYPILSNVYPHRPAASWIPDFQHRHLPEFFSKEEYIARETRFARIADEARMVVLSSYDAEKDYRQFYPNSCAVTKVLPFYAFPQEQWYEGNPVSIQEFYQLPDKFLICCNQFWIHKNHKRLFESIAILRRQGRDVYLVCTGSTSDYRAAAYFDDLKRYLKELNIEDLVHILGLIPRENQVQLIRRSAAVVQPSLFEGWSTVVEDCRVLGKTMILSDLPVNIEQNPDHSFYFNRTDAADLAKKITEVWHAEAPGPNIEREAQAKEKAASFVENFARRFSDIVLISKQVFG